MNDMDNKVQSAQEFWRVGHETMDGVPPGIYQLQLSDVTYAISSGGHPQIKRTHLVLEGKFAGQPIWDNITIANEIGAKQACRWLKLCGVTPPSELDGLESALDEIHNLAPKVQAELYYSGDFPNLKNFRFISAEGTPAAPTAEEAPEAEAEAESEPDETGLKKGDKVSFEDEGKTITGVITAITSKGYDVEEDGSGEEWEELSGNELKPILEDKPKNKSKKKKAPAKKKKAGGGDLKKRALEFCQDNEVEDITDESSEAELIEAIKGYNWDPDQFSDKEKEFMKEIGAII